MRLLRALLVGLVAFCVAAGPLAVLAVAPSMAASSAALATSAGMPDCHGKMGASSTNNGPAQHKSHKHCPGCEKGNCAADACQIKCFKVVADLPRAAEMVRATSSHFDAARPERYSPLELQPQPPPPRA